nr:MAG TPA: hypothetical protein [Caudoviricetes sp.]
MVTLGLPDALSLFRFVDISIMHYCFIICQT